LFWKLKEGVRHLDTHGVSAEILFSGAAVAISVKPRSNARVSNVGAAWKHWRTQNVNGSVGRRIVPFWHGKWTWAVSEKGKCWEMLWSDGTKGRCSTRTNGSAQHQKTNIACNRGSHCLRGRWSIGVWTVIPAVCLNGGGDCKRVSVSNDVGILCMYIHTSMYSSWR
jgi:hypothetical protein